MCGFVRPTTPELRVLFCLSVQELWDPSSDEYIPVQYGPEEVVQGGALGGPAVVVGGDCGAVYSWEQAKAKYILVELLTTVLQQWIYTLRLPR